MKGETVNLFDDDRAIETTEDKEITVVRLNGYLITLEDKRAEILRKNGVIENWIKIKDKFEEVEKNEEQFNSLVDFVKKEYNFKDEHQAYYYIVTGGLIGEDSYLNSGEDFIGNVSKIGKENGLTYLTFLPIYDKDKSLEKNIMHFLEIKKENRITKPKELYINGNCISLEEVMRSIDIL